MAFCEIFNQIFLQTLFRYSDRNIESFIFWYDVDQRQAQSLALLERFDEFKDPLSLLARYFSWDLKQALSDVEWHPAVEVLALRPYNSRLISSLVTKLCEKSVEILNNSKLCFNFD